MSEPKFTPGPWRVDDMGTRVLGENHGHAPTPQQPVRVVAQCSTFCTARTSMEVTANAHLIAAAPNMYEALKEASAILHDTIDTEDGQSGELIAACKAARAALAKAEGKQMEDTEKLPVLKWSKSERVKLWTAGPFEIAYQYEDGVETYYLRISGYSLGWRTSLAEAQRWAWSLATQCADALEDDDE